MTAYPAWTPASRPGIVPLHPYGFGTILGRSFVALRHNPKVLLGFALITQTAAYLILTAAVAGAAVASFTRLDTVAPGSDDYDAILAGSIVLTAATALVLGVATGALSVIVQGVVVAEVAHAVVSEKPTLKAVWGRVKPVVWRLIGYSALTLLATVVALGVLAGIVALLVMSVLWLGILVGILAVLGLIVVALWLAAKLFLVPSVIILERSPVFRAIGRSWRLTRGRFWSTLGVVVVISVAFSIIAQIISIPFSLIGSLVPAILAPTGETESGALIGVIGVQIIGQFGILLVQCIALVVQSTSAVLVYVDARMRVEALDHDLQTYVEARDAGATDLDDPYLVGVGRVVARPAPFGAQEQSGYGGVSSYGAPAASPVYGAPAGSPVYGAPAGSPGYGAPAASPVYGAPAGSPGYGAPAGDAPPPPPVPAPNAPPTPHPQSPTTWAAPGSNGDA
ncbi:glycerophosphoryl diester phosphodiesterase membrane domain-containing protein [Microbacterium enclense]|uniref:glycerophosphoryl diester phosphodiesterase membrane domain-containing protein n=1 Tax=Microbacterium enclense TaxID=993073 RepID=UPI002040DC5D|nr:glycerophosphoryl diester phosphodiesterase membrane domain-containing protein [Microbacterium enclense]MCM3613761.1 glycerophosphoryl diester phosphodiesterase membrane domain-containing protein [Microbacterium enclense]